MWSMLVQRRLRCLGSSGLHITQSRGAASSTMGLTAPSAGTSPPCRVDEEHPVRLRAASGAGPRVCSKGLVHGASGDPGRRQVGITPHKCTRAEKVWATYEESEREWGDGLEKHLCGESSFPGPEPERSLQVLGLSLWAPGRERAEGVCRCLTCALLEDFGC